MDIDRESYEDGNKKYAVTYREATPKDERDDRNPSGNDVLTVRWGINPDGVLQEDQIPYSVETLRTIANRITEFENSELGLVQASPEKNEWPSRTYRAREFARRIFRIKR